jgi:hypothetical protein
MIYDAFFMSVALVKLLCIVYEKKIKPINENKNLKSKSDLILVY